jgi:peptidoglycan hydrolase-like protein with peptidoglycan-binding domain
VSTWGSALRRAGLKVVDEPVPGRPFAFGPPRGILLHHTAGKAPGDLGVVTRGRAGIPGPLSQLYLAPDGTWHVITTGRANHAGYGRWNSRGLVIPKDSGNEFLIGIEVSHLGNAPITGAQYLSLVKGVAALCRLYGWDAGRVIRHTDYAGPRKVDIRNNLTKVRGHITKQIAAQTPKSSFPLPKGHVFWRKPSRTQHDGRADVFDRAAVRRIQKRLGVRQTGHFGPITAAKVSIFQWSNGIKVSGKVGAHTWRRLGL